MKGPHRSFHIRWDYRQAICLPKIKSMPFPTFRGVKCPDHVGSPSGFKLESGQLLYASGSAFLPGLPPLQEATLSRPRHCTTVRGSLPSDPWKSAFPLPFGLKPWGTSPTALGPVPAIFEEEKAGFLLPENQDGSRETVYSGMYWDHNLGWQRQARLQRAADPCYSRLRMM